MVSMTPQDWFELLVLVLVHLAIKIIARASRG